MVAFAALAQFRNTCDLPSMASHPYLPTPSSPSLHLSLLHPASTFYPQLQLRGQPLFSITITSRLIKEFSRPAMHAFFPCRCSNSQDTTHYTVFRTLFSFFQEMGIRYEETEMLLVNNPNLALSSMDSLRARVLSLKSVGLDHVSLCYLVIKRPTVLTAEEIDPFLSFVRDELEGKLEQAQLKRLLSGTKPRFLVGFRHKVELLLYRGVPHGKIARVLNKLSLSKALCHRSVDEIDRTIAFFNPFGGVCLITRRPELLNYDLENQLIPRIQFLIELSGGDEDGAGRLLRKFPAILSYRVEHIEAHVELLRSFAGLNDQEIFRILLAFPSIIRASRQRKLRPRIEFLKECGLDSGDIFKFLIKATTFVGHSSDENIAHKLLFLVKIGFKYRTKDLAMAIGSTTWTSCENMQKVISLFLSYGFSSEHIVAMSKKHPRILRYDHTFLEKKMKYLIEEMGCDIIVELQVFPALLGYKFRGRIKQRSQKRRKA